jgi:hypothetical protein
MPQSDYISEVKKAVISFYEKKYWDFGPTLAVEKLDEEDGYKLHAETLRLWLKEAGIWQPKQVRGQENSALKIKPKQKITLKRHLNGKITSKTIVDLVC